MLKMNMHSNDAAIYYLSYNVAYLRKKQKFSKEKMAKILGIGIQTLTKIEQGVLPPRLRVEVLFRMQHYFGIHVSELVGRKLEQ